MPATAAGVPMSVAPAWIQQHCVVPDGFRAGEPFRLYDYQLRYFAEFYRVKNTAVWRPENPVKGPAFVYRRGMLIGPQKLGKGPHTAAHITLEGVGPALFAGWAGDDDGYVCADWGCRCGWEWPYNPGEPMGMPWPTPLIQLTAFSEEQTQNVYDALRPMIEKGPLAALIPKTGEEFIRLPGGGRIDTVTSSALSRLGQRVTFVPQDEVGVWTKANKMTGVADTQYRGLAGMGGRSSLTTNMYDPSEHSVAQREREARSSDVYVQVDLPPAGLRFTDRRDRRRIISAVYPKDTWVENGGHIDRDAIEGEAADMVAKGEASQAARFFGNIEARAAGAAVDPKRWAELERSDVVVPVGGRIGLGFDGSLSDDSTACVGCWVDDDGLPHLFVPRWWNAELGEEVDALWLNPLPSVRRGGGAVEDNGWRVPKSQVKAMWAYVFGTYDVGRFLGDPPKWQTELEDLADEHGDETVLLFDTNQPKRMSAACDRFREHVGTAGHREHRLAHAGHSILTEHTLAMVRKRAYLKNEDPNDGRTRYVFTKPDDGRKIDAGIAAVLALEAAMTMPEPPARKVPLVAWAGDDDYDEEDEL